jgi:hypothetical protein
MGTRNPQREAIITLGWLADNGYVLQATCGRCEHQTSVQVIPLAIKLGRQATMHEAARRMKCRQCGKRVPDLAWIKWDRLLPQSKSSGHWIAGG